MPAIGGAVESVDIAGRAFSVAADADSNRTLGGFTNETMPNGDGSVRYIKTRVPWGIDGLALTIDDDQEDLEYLQSKANEKGDFPIAFTFVNGAVYQGTGQLEGEFPSSSSSATAPVAFKGSGVLTKQ